MVDNRRQQYQEHRNRAAERQADIAEAGQEIGPPPERVNLERWESCRFDFKLYCETYHQPIFCRPWSKDHLKAIKKIERAVLHGELFALAMPRGSGKSSLCRCAVLWAILYGHHHYACLVAATQGKARKELTKIANALERNPLLLEDFPGACFPIRELDRSPQRAKKQRSNGEYTNMVWTKDVIVLPTMPDADSSSAIITACGLTGGEIRGQSQDMPDGSILRPTLVFLDDPQTRKSARSRTQNDERIELLQGDVLGMAGHDRTISGVMACTVIQPGDMADQILNQEENPDWQGERTKMVYAWPENDALWEEYFELRDAGLRCGDTSKSDEQYRKNRAAMDLGSVVAWEAGFPEKKCLSAIQYAMNLRHRNETVFFAEFQNEPLTDDNEDDLLTAEQIAAKLNRREPGTIPASCNTLAMHIDVHKKLLYWTIMAFEDDFTGYVVDYGTYPDQKKSNFTMRAARRTLLTAHRGEGEEAAIYAGLEAVTKQNLGREWPRDDGASMKIGLCLVDCRYQKDTVDLFVRQSRFAGGLLPAAGLGIKASNNPLSTRTAKKGEKIGEEWRISGAQGKHALRMTVFDANYWKSFLQSRLAVAMGGKGCLSLYGRSETRHRLYSEHLTAEFRVKTEGRGRKVDEWQEYTHHPDNHWLDASVGCCVAASILGCRLLGVNLKRTGRKKRPPKKAARYF